MQLNELIDRQRQNIATHHAILTQRKTIEPDAPRADFAGRRGWRNIAIEVRDTAFASRPKRSLVLGGNDYHATIFSEGGKPIDDFDLRQSDAGDRIARYEFP